MDIFDTVTLLGVIRVQKPPTTYWLDNFFPRTITFDTEEIMFDVVNDQRRLAPFVSPNVQGRVMREKGYSTKTFRPAYVKPKHVVNPSRAIPRLAGESIAGSLSLLDRYNAIVAENMRLEKEMILRRCDWMAARALIDGSVTVEGDDYPSVTVDFGRDASLSVTLTSTAKWDAISTADPLADIKSLRQKAFELGRSPIDRLTFGLSAWDLFVQNAKVKDLLNTFTRGSATTFNTAIPDPGPYQFMGRLQGEGGQGGLDMWTYNDVYDNADGTTTSYMDQLSVVGTGNNIQGVRCYGAIQDRRAGLVATDMFPKMWDEEDPSVTYTLTQSAPLMVPAQPNSAFTIKVAT